MGLLQDYFSKEAQLERKLEKLESRKRELELQKKLTAIQKEIDDITEPKKEDIKKIETT